MIEHGFYVSKEELSQLVPVLIELLDTNEEIIQNKQNEKGLK